MLNVKVIDKEMRMMLELIYYLCFGFIKLRLILIVIERFLVFRVYKDSLFIGNFDVDLYNFNVSRGFNGFVFL